MTKVKNSDQTERSEISKLVRQYVNEQLNFRNDVLTSVKEYKQQHIDSSSMFNFTNSKQHSIDIQAIELATADPNPYNMLKDLIAIKYDIVVTQKNPNSKLAKAIQDGINKVSEKCSDKNKLILAMTAPTSITEKASYYQFAIKSYTDAQNEGEIDKFKVVKKK